MKELPKRDAAEKEDRAMEGRATRADGSDAGDANFHEAGWGFGEETEKKTLEDLSARVVDLEERQVEGIAASDPDLGAKGFRQLLERHPESERAAQWKKRIDELEK